MSAYGTADRDVCPRKPIPDPLRLPRSGFLHRKDRGQPRLPNARTEDMFGDTRSDRRGPCGQSAARGASPVWAARGRGQAGGFRGQLGRCQLSLPLPRPSLGGRCTVSSDYSWRSLLRKLGIRAGDRISIENEPDNFRELLGPLPDGVKVLGSRAAKLDFLQVFVTELDQLADWFPRAKERLKPDGMIWVSWPKLSSPLSGDLNENVVRELGLAAELVDVKVVSIDTDWSGLKFVVRLDDRPGAAGRGLGRERR